MWCCLALRICPAIVRQIGVEFSESVLLISLLGMNHDLIDILVPREGLEPTHLREVADFKSAASAVSPPRHVSKQKAQRLVKPKRCAELSLASRAVQVMTIFRLLSMWRRRADSNRRIEVLQTSALTTWLRRLVSALCCLDQCHARSHGTIMVPRAGLEPTRAKAHGPLKTACLPFPPPRLARSVV